MDATCEACSDHCHSCDVAGPGKCDTCVSGFTKSSDGAACSPCAAHCRFCDVAGPGKCDECDPGFMVGGEDSPRPGECAACIAGCAVCHNLEACDKCFPFRKPNAAATECAWSTAKIGSASAVGAGAAAALWSAFFVRPGSIPPVGLALLAALFVPSKCAAGTAAEDEVEAVGKMIAVVTVITMAVDAFKRGDPRVRRVASVG